MTDIKLLSKNKYLKVPLLYSGTGGDVPEWRKHLQPCEWLETDGNCYIQTDLKYYRNKNFSIWIYCTSAKPALYMIANNGTQNVSIKRNEGGVGSYSQTNTIEQQFSSSAGKFEFFLRNGYLSITGRNRSAIGGYWKFIENLSFFGNAENISPIGVKIFNDIYQIENFHLYTCYVIDEYTDNKANLCTAGVSGMVDIGTGIFYTNDGTGHFLHGADIEI